MEIYSKESYGSYAEFKRSFVKELKQAFTGTKVSYRDKNAYITDFCISNSNIGEHIMVSLDVDGETKQLALDLATGSGVIKFNEDANKAYNELMELFNQSAKIFEEESAKEREIAAEKARLFREKCEAERARREEIKKQIEADKRYARKVKKALDKLACMKPEKTANLFETPTSHYEILGWMAKHLTSIKAAMPDYMEKWFVGRFGDVERYVVNSKKKTSGGFAYQWGLGLKLTFDEDVKGPLEQRATSKNKKVIDNVAFVWDLIENYGFQFGKEQNISQIKAEIPEENLVDFEKGYAM